MKRVVIFQGQYGFFPVHNLSLSMPAIQTCIGVYGFSNNNHFLMAAHFDTDKCLRENVDNILKGSFKTTGVHLGDFSVNVFGGDGILSYLRCSTPTTYIGEAIIQELMRRGVENVRYDTEHYSGITGRTYNLRYLTGKGLTITCGQHPADFAGANNIAANKARARIKKRPQEYSNDDARMYDVSDL
ncbi:hypothetical protein [Enterobacter mori]|uniref:hypothetical protein n=1 Tax=Enterobacter mori TaxID=539813 RepID=UPI003B840F9E